MDIHAAGELALSLMREHGITAAGWRFTFDSAKMRLGCCKYGQRLITLSAPLTVECSEAVVRDTILHEIAHVKAGPGAYHGPLWKIVARSIGAQPTACSTAHVATKAKWNAKCPNCGKIYRRHRLTRPTATRWCPPCGREKGQVTFIMGEV